MREAIACSQVPGVSLHGPIRCTATIGVSEGFTSSQALDQYTQQADAALYRGKMAGRNRVEWGHGPESTHRATLPPAHDMAV